MVAKNVDVAGPWVRVRVAPLSPPMDLHNHSAEWVVDEVAARASSMADVGSKLDDWTEACIDQHYMRQTDPDSPEIAELEKSWVVAQRVSRRKRLAKGPSWRKSNSCRVDRSASCSSDR